MRIYNLYYDPDLMYYISCRINHTYKVNKGIILEDNHNILGFILYHNETKNNDHISYIDYIFADTDSHREVLLTKFYNKLKHLNYNLILYPTNLDIETINKYIELKYKLFSLNTNENTCILYKKIIHKK